MCLCVDTVYPGVITSNQSKVKTGADVDFKCTLKDSPGNGTFLAFLCRNGTISDIKMWDSAKKEAIFHRMRVQQRDTANYSCMVSNRPLAPTELGACGGELVFLKVVGKKHSSSQNV